MLFKTRSGLTPQTPKIGSVSLPDDHGGGLRFSMPIVTPRNRNFLDRRSATPAPERPPSRAQYDSAMRTRTNSLSSTSTSAKAPPKSILKSTKVEPLALPHDNVSCSMGRTVYPLAGEYSRPKFPVDERNYRSSYSIAKTFSSSAYDYSRAYFSDDGAPPKVHKSSSDPSHHRRRSSSQDRAKDVLVTKAPMKEESIVLSWPLVDYSYRKMRSKIPGPSLYFDIAFDPRIPLNVRIDRGGVRTTISLLEQAIPVSTHCEVTKMTIICPPLSRWPIKVRQRNGITCFDVFCAIYETFHERLTEEDLAIIPRDFFDDKFRKAFKIRCKDSPGLPEYNLKQGPLRVDLLKGRRIFQGVERAGADWELTIDRGSSRP